MPVERRCAVCSVHCLWSTKQCYSTGSATEAKIKKQNKTNRSEVAHKPVRRSNMQTNTLGISVSRSLGLVNVEHLDRIWYSLFSALANANGHNRTVATSPGIGICFSLALWLLLEYVLFYSVVDRRHSDGSSYMPMPMQCVIGWPELQWFQFMYTSFLLFMNFHRIFVWIFLHLNRLILIFVVYGWQILIVY